MSLLARSKPYPTTPAGKYVCERCGITKNRRKNSTHCNDCKRFVKGKE